MELFKVLIVDDEPTIREGLAALIPWEEYMISQVETAENGIEALHKHERLVPDLMIVDIKMPGMTGIELMERIRKRDPSVDFIILSGYAEFEYAKRAISFGVEGYLLKPIVEEELMDYLDKLKLKWEQERDYRQMKDKLEAENKERMLESLLRGNVDAQVTEFFRKLGWSHYRLLFITLDNDLELANRKQQLKAYFKKDDSVIVCTHQRRLVIASNGQFFLSHQPNVIYEKLQRLFPMSEPFAAALTDPVERIEELPTVYQIAEQLLANKFFYDEQQILTSQSKPIFSVKGNKKEQGKSSETQMEKLIYMIELGDQQAVKDICLEMGEQWTQENPIEESIKKNYIHLVSTLINKWMSDYKELTNLMEKVMEIEKQPTIDRLLIHVNSILVEIMEQIDREDSDLIVKKMIHLIERHYHSNIKLDTLAETLHYHRGYLGQLFKDSTGQYFNTYLDKVRIENSKKLLLQDLKVYQVAERIGYANVDYFHSKFKKYVGISPSEYRKKKAIEK